MSALFVPLGGPLLWAGLGDGGAEVLAWNNVLTLLLADGNTTEKVLNKKCHLYSLFKIVKTYSVVVPALTVTLGIDVTSINWHVVSDSGNVLAKGWIIGHSKMIDHTLCVWLEL